MRQCNPKETVTIVRAAPGETAGPRQAIYSVFVSPKRLCNIAALSRGFEAEKQQLWALLEFSQLRFASPLQTPPPFLHHARVEAVISSITD